MNKILTVLGILLHTFCYLICFFPFGKLFSFGSALAELAVGTTVLIILLVLTHVIYFADAIVAWSKNKSLFNKIKLGMVLVASPIFQSYRFSKNAGYVLVIVYSGLLLGVEIFSLFVKENIKE